jgi:hypothetical protein
LENTIWYINHILSQLCGTNTIPCLQGLLEASCAAEQSKRYDFAINTWGQLSITSVRRLAEQAAARSGGSGGSGTRGQRLRRRLQGGAATPTIA